MTKREVKELNRNYPSILAQLGLDLNDHSDDDEEGVDCTVEELQSMIDAQFWMNDLELLEDVANDEEDDDWTTYDGSAYDDDLALLEEEGF